MASVGSSSYLKVTLMLVSIFFASNRSQNMLEFFDNIEEMTADYSCLEILIKIDIEDPESKSFLDKEISKRPFVIKYINTPQLGGYYDLWKGYNELWENTSKDAYFIWPINDELRIQTKNWDQIISRYAALFSDHVYRLRVSQFKFRNYFYLWECFPTPDNYAIFTRRWVELVGGFGDCHGMDAYAQGVMFYLWKLDNLKQISRDIPILDLELEGEDANVGDSDEDQILKSKGVKGAWLTLASHEQRLNYMRQARTIQAYIDAHKMGIDNFTISYDKNRSAIILYDKTNKKVVREYYAKVSMLLSLLKSVLYRLRSTPSFHLIAKNYNNPSLNPYKKFIIIVLAILLLPLGSNVVPIRNCIGRIIGFILYDKYNNRNILGIFVKYITNTIKNMFPDAAYEESTLKKNPDIVACYEFNLESNSNIQYSENDIFPAPKEAINM